jgi:transcription elongation GreA/GreB family factor
LELGTVRALYFLVPQGGGLVTSVDGRPVQVITPQSPLGERMLGKKVGDSFTVETASGGQRTYRVVSIV